MSFRKPEIVQDRPSFASKTAFALLAPSDDEDEEVEVSEPEEKGEAPKLVIAEPVKPAKLSKSAQKRAARAARQQQLQTGERVPQPDTKTNPVESVMDNSTQSPNGSTEVGVSNINAVTEKSSPHPPTTSETPADPMVLPNERSGSPPSRKSSFQPELPPLPHPSQVPIVRKRKASHDLPSKPVFKESKVEFESDEESDGEGDDATCEPNPPPEESPEEQKMKKLRNAGTRTLWTLIMIGGFITLLAMGHAYMILMVLVCQSVVYREVTSLFTLRDDRESKDPWRKTLNWYFFAITNYFLYGESIIYYFKHVMFADALLLPFATNHRLISFMLYTIGFVGFVASLKKQYLKQQFGLFCWVHMSLLLIVVSSHFIVNNILEGLIWFWVPASLVICNDCFAYIWGITIGRTPLIKLSPKKTVEGFVGAFFSTLLFGVVWGTIFMQYNYMICPVKDLGVSALSDMTCKPNPVFVWREWEIPAPLRFALTSIFGNLATKIPYAPYQFHVLVMATFASLVAPFGGFFASGFKRAFDIKDFGDSIPGHGGMTDRMDCQFLMGMFSYVYYSSLIRQNHVTVGSVLQAVFSGLTADEQVELYVDLKRYLEGRGLL
ncbi:cytidylyltransferase family-domain-containing protein [Hysterangium stoloniferum]|nr:cytidylyltransferase family-domain-containing protein [Hysterangium stoloniferum]